VHKQVQRTWRTLDGKGNTTTSYHRFHEDVERRIGTHAKLLAEFVKLRLHLRVYSYCYCRLCHNLNFNFWWQHATISVAKIQQISDITKFFFDYFPEDVTLK
jgi:esterase/lipase superfamily enzyme